MGPIGLESLLEHFIFQNFLEENPKPPARGYPQIFTL